MIMVMSSSFEYAQTTCMGLPFLLLPKIRQLGNVAEQISDTCL